MADARPLRDVFADLVGVPGGAADPAALLDDQGHPGLPEDLVAEAVVSYADTAPVEVAEHLAPYVAAHSVIGAEPGDEPPAAWPGLLGTAPDVGVGEAVEVDGPAPVPEVEAAPAPDFGAGAEPQAPIDLDEGPAEEETPVEDEEISDIGWEPVELDVADLTAEGPDAEDDDEPDAELPG